MAKITLPSGHVMYFDECDRWLVEKYAWHVDMKGYARAQTRRDGKIKNISFHKMITPDCPKEKFRDHINRNRLDNRRNNLRFVTAQQNAWNRNPNKNNPTGYKGVSIEQGKYFRAHIREGGKKIWIGYFPTAEAAAKAYDKAAKKIHGKYARLNFPEK